MSEPDKPLEPAVAGVRIRWGVRIPLRDGVHLNGTLYLPPRHETPTPALFTLTPYIAQTFHDLGMYFAAHGFPFLGIDVRGRGNSEGDFRPLLNEADDAFDIVEWIARQPFCDGKVAMWGGSYGGYVQWAAASRLPRHLATIVPVASPCIGVDFPIRNNIAAPYWMQWLTLVAGRTSQDKMFWNAERYWGATFRRWFESGAPLKALDEQIGMPSAVFQEWAQHPHPDDYWDSYNPTPEQYARIELPVLTITGHYDGDQLGALAHYQRHLQNATAEARSRHYLVIGPWDHSGTRVPMREFCGLKVGPESMIDMPRLHLEWYRWTMQGGPKPALLKKRVAYYVMGAECWRYADDLEEVTERLEPLYLQSNGVADDVFASGMLTRNRGGSQAPDRYVYDPRDVSLAELESTVDPENRADQCMIHARTGKQLVYHSAAFAEPVEISGFFRLSVWLAIDQPDTDFRASVYEVKVDGSAILLSMDSMRARYRLDPRVPRLISTREPLCYDFNRFMFVSKRLERLSRLRLVIGPVSSIYHEKNYNSGGIVADESVEHARTVTVSLYHDREHASVLYVPIGRMGQPHV